MKFGIYIRFIDSFPIMKKNIGPPSPQFFWGGLKMGLNFKKSSSELILMKFGMFIKFMDSIPMMKKSIGSRPPPKKNFLGVKKSHTQISYKKNSYHTFASDVY